MGRAWWFLIGWDLPQGFPLQAASAINNAGQIIVVASSVQEPESLYLLLAGLGWSHLGRGVKMQENSFGIAENVLIGLPAHPSDGPSVRAFSAIDATVDVVGPVLCYCHH